MSEGIFLSQENYVKKVLEKFGSEGMNSHAFINPFDRDVTSTPSVIGEKPYRELLAVKCTPVWPLDQIYVPQLTSSVNFRPMQLKSNGKVSSEFLGILRVHLCIMVCGTGAS